MRCSLLLLSTHLDGELNQRRVAELDAHLIACSRCQAGLGYLREESQRIAGLARVRVPDHSAHALLTALGLIAPEDDLPGNLPQQPPEADDADTPPWVGGPPGKALPWSPPERHVTGSPVVNPAPHVHTGSGVATLELPPTPPAESVATPQSTTPQPEMAQLEVPGFAVTAGERTTPHVGLEPADLQPEAVTSAADVGDAADRDAVEPMTAPSAAPPITPPSHAPTPPPIVPPVPQRVPPGVLPNALRRMRDAVAVRWALARGGRAAFEGAVDIGPLPRQSPGPAPIDDWKLPPRKTRAPVAETSIAAVPASAALPPTVTPPSVEPELADVERVPSPPRRAPRPPKIGRHKRGVATGHSQTTGLQDRRLWAFAATTLVLLAIGLLVGRQVQTTPVAQRPAAHSAPATQVPRASVPPHTAAPTAAPTPPPSLAPSPLHLTGARTLGSGAAGYAVADLRYGTHPGDFRIVFDLTSATEAGSPSVTIGMGNPTTLYVIFAAVSPSEPPVPPHSASVTDVSLLSPSPMPGHTVYEIALGKPATFSALYLSNATRLVLDIH
jgi:Putative zinc-finger